MRTLLLLLLGAALIAPAAAQDRAVEGKTAPDFTIQRLDSTQKVTLSKLAATKPVLLIFGSYT